MYRLGVKHSYTGWRYVLCESFSAAISAAEKALENPAVEKVTIQKKGEVAYV